MNVVDTLNGWLRGLANKAGIGDLQLNEKGVCALRYGEDLEFVVEAPEGSGMVYMYSPILTLPEENREILYEKLLKLNFFCLETGGATFALDKRKGTIILCYGHPVEKLDALSFENLVSNFLETADKWRKEFMRPQEPQPSQTKKEPEKAPIMDLRFRA